MKTIKNITFNDIKKGDVKVLTKDEFFMFEKSRTVDIITKWTLLVAKFSWYKPEYVFLNNSEASEAITMGFEVEEGSKTKNMYAIKMKDGEPVKNYMHVCNFRRYGWAETPSSDGEYGYSNNVIYSNVEDGGLTCSTPEQVVRETLIKFMEKSNIPEVLKFNHSVRPIWQALLDDALANISGYASYAVNSTNGTTGQVVVNGVQKDAY